MAINRSTIEKSSAGLLKLSRSQVYYVPREQCQEYLDLIDQQHLETLYYGSRKMRIHLQRKGRRINPKRVQRLMRTMGIQAAYPVPGTSVPGDGHNIYPCLLKGLKIDRPRQVWAADISYVPLARGFMYLMYLVAIIDWSSRKVLSCRVSNTMDTEFFIDAWRMSYSAMERRRSSTQIGRPVHQRGVNKLSQRPRHPDQHARQSVLP